MTRRHTRQRDVILQVLQDAEGPLSVPELHARARHELASLGVATVYRTLKLLQDGGQVRALFLDGESRFERADLGHHHHFACRNCKKVFDLASCPLALPGGAHYPDGFVVETHEVTLYGLCPGCAS